MTLVVINFDEHQFLIICIAMLIASALTLAIAWPWADQHGYERRGRERPEPHPDLEWMKTHREREHG